jgi:long-chain fatty acid transport protein
VSIGGLYRIRPKWTLRAGFEYDESPVDAKDRTPRVPDADRYWFTVGASYEYSESFSFDFAYTYIYISDYSIDDTEVTTGAVTGVPVGNTLDGRYEGNANILSAQVRWTF